MSAKLSQMLEYTPVRLKIYEFLAFAITTRPEVQFIKTINTLSQEGFPWLCQFVKEDEQPNFKDLSTKLVVDWTRTFRGVKPGYGPPPARTSAYRTCNIPALHDIYREAGLSLAGSRFDPDDLGIQLSFLYVLVERELNLLQHGQYLEVNLLQSKQAQFIKHHLEWVPDFCTQAEKGLELSFYKEVLCLLREFLDEDLLWLEGEKEWN